MDTPRLTSSVDELLDLIRKDEGIISTHTASDFKKSANSVEEKYRTYAETHISLGDTSDFDVYEKLVRKDAPTTGYLYGPFGYGKTSTSVSVWNELNGNDVIAVPPFTVTSFSSIMRATYGWIHHKLSTEAPGYVDELESIRESYLQKEIKSYAKEKKHHHDIDVGELVTMFEEMEQTGELDLSIKATTLMDFFDECTKLALEAGFEGLVVIGDELQQYFKSADNRQDAEARFRDLVFEIDSGAQISNRFGLMISMPAQTKSQLDTRAGDVLNRLESDNLMLNLKNVYGRTFPTELWGEYASRFGFVEDQYKIISEQALTAVGEICSRPELSNGPRTVIDILRIALQQYQTSNNQFTALNLAEAFYDGEVRYQGSSTIIQTAIGDALDHASVTTPNQQDFIKLCAVFPEAGIPEEAVKRYNLSDARRQLSKKLHGEVIKVIGDGYTLIDVTRTDGPQDVVRELIRDFWNEYDTDHVNARHAHKALSNRLICGKIFQPQRGKLDGWGTGDGLSREAPRVYRRTGMIGTFDTDYPKREATVAVTDVSNKEDIVGTVPLGPGEQKDDIAFNYILGWEKGGNDTVEPHIQKTSDREYTFVLDGRQTFDELPEGIEFLRDAMDPNAVNPFLMLALINYLDETDRELDPQQEQRIKSFQDSLLKQSIRTLFDSELIESAQMNIRRAGKRAVAGVFSDAMDTLYPEYDTLMASPQYESMMEDYIDFLDTLQTVSLCRGIDMVTETKEEAVQRFNLKNTSSFSGRVKKHYSDLIEEINDSKEKYKYKAKLHPFEEVILNRLESGERDEFPLSEAKQIGLQRGYKHSEIQLIFKFLVKRRVVSVSENDSLVLVETDYTISEVQEALERARRLISTLEQMESGEIPDDVNSTIEEIEVEVEQTNPEDGQRIEVLFYRTQEQVETLEQEGKVIHGRHYQACEDLQHRVERKSRQVVPDQLNDTIRSGVQFVGGLNEARNRIRGNYIEIRNKLKELANELNHAIDEHGDRSLDNAVTLSDIHEEIEDQVESLDNQTEKLEERVDKLKDWKTFATRVAGLNDEITDYARTFDSEPVEVKQKLDDLIDQISERFADEPVGALDNLGGFKSNLDRIETEYSTKRRQHQEVFNQKRKTLKQILQNATDGSARGLRSAKFSIQNPEESRQDLLDEFKKAYRSNVIEQSEKYIEDARREVKYARVVGIDTTVEVSPNAIEERVNKAESSLTDIEYNLDHFSFTDIGDDTSLGSDGSELLNTAEEIVKDAKKFRDDRPPDDEEISETLERIKNNRRVDFKDLLMEYHDIGDNVEPEELLDRIQRLFVLNQIDIEITQRRG